jgi:hypothetical protein
MGDDQKHPAHYAACLSDFSKDKKPPFSQSGLAIPEWDKLYGAGDRNRTYRQFTKSR